MCSGRYLQIVRGKNCCSVITCTLKTDLNVDIKMEENIPREQRYGKTYFLKVIAGGIYNNQ